MTRADADRVLVTRTEPGADGLIDALERAGFATLRHPLLEIRARAAPEAERLSQELGGFAAVIVVSVHAAEHGIAALNAALKRRRRTAARDPVWISVGRTTAAALAAHGVTAQFPEDETSEGILAMPALSAISGKRVLIVAGVGGRTLLSEVLGARGARVVTLFVYERVVSRKALAPSDVARIGTVVISSADGGRAFADTWRAVDGSKHVRVVVPSERVRTTLIARGFQNVILSNGATDAAVVEALTRATSPPDAHDR